jgi:alanine racemase
VSRRPTVARVDLEALGHNFRTLAAVLLRAPADVAPGFSPAADVVPGFRPARPLAGPGIIAVVKANAYGHGAERVALALEAAGAPAVDAVTFARARLQVDEAR